MSHTNHENCSSSDCQSCFCASALNCCWPSAAPPIALRRSKVVTAKQSMDLNHLQLENLLYERDHLSRETQLCKDFT